MAWTKWLAVGIGTFIGSSVIAATYGSWRWNKETAQMRARLEAARQLPATRRYDVREIALLPAPVQRYFRAVLQDGQPIVTAASVGHSGKINMGETNANWKPFTSNQRIVTQRPGFDWDARIMMLPGVPVHVHDAYIAGRGVLRGAVAGLVPVAKEEDSPELAPGELLRFFAEAAWYPTALLPSQGVQWQAVDDTSARATLVDSAISVSLTFVFRPEGPIDTIRAESRGRTVDGVTVGRPWVGRFWNHEVKSGMLVATEGEVAWILPGGPWPYWNARNTSMAYEFAQ